MRFFIIFGLLSPLFVAETCLAANTRVNAPHIGIELLAEHRRVPAGGTTRIALKLMPEKGWHIYWRNPGDTGLMPKVAWEHPNSISISEFSWAFPEAIPVAHLMNFGFHKELILPATLTLSDDVELGERLIVSADVEWLVCKESCIPGKAELFTEFLVDHESIKRPTIQKQLDEWQSRIPQEEKALMSRATFGKNLLTIELFAQRLLFRDADHVELFIEETDLVKYNTNATAEWANNRLVWQQHMREYFVDAPEEIHYVIVIDNEIAYRFRTPTNVNKP